MLTKTLEGRFWENVDIQSSVAVCLKLESTTIVFAELLALDYIAYYIILLKNNKRFVILV